MTSGFVAQWPLRHCEMVRRRFWLLATASAIVASGFATQGDVVLGDAAVVVFSPVYLHSVDLRHFSYGQPLKSKITGKMSDKGPISERPY
jgi:hypothetical protein